MPICIECRYPVHSLYTTYSKADDRSQGKGVRLTQCPRCKRFADKYVEHDFVVLFIDLVLIKPQVYRHLLFNRLGREDDNLDPSIVRLGVLLLLFDVYLTWARIEKANPPVPSSPSPSSSSSSQMSQPQPQRSTGSQLINSALSSQPLFAQYCFFLLLCSLSTLAFHLPIRLLCAHPPVLSANLAAPLRRLAAWASPQHPNSPSTTAAPTAAASSSSSTASIPTPSTRISSNNISSEPLYLLPPYPHPNPLSSALLVSSCTKLFPILLIVWDYDLPSSATAVSWAVIANNVAAVEILTGCGYWRAGILVGVGAVAREVVAGMILGAVGLGEKGVGNLWGVLS